MFSIFTLFLCFACGVVARNIPRQASSDGSVTGNTAASRGWSQNIPAAAPADSSFNNGQPMLTAEPPQTGANDDNGPYGATDIDLPFNRMFHGNLMFFPEGESNSPNGSTDAWTDQGGVDSPAQSACGIPNNAYYISHVAIHPYFLKYADLSRYCMPDVCISFWKEDFSSDMMLKVTDICSTDPNDPTACKSPSDIKIDRTKAKIWQTGGNSPDSNAADFAGDSFPQQAKWFFMKCWADGTAQPAYQDNWFNKPAFNNNLQWAQGSATKQYQNNQASYPAKGWQPYTNCAYNTSCEGDTITDWSQGDSVPTWTPIAGGKGFSGANGASGAGNSSTATAGEGNGSAAASGNSSTPATASNPGSIPEMAQPGNSTMSSTATASSSQPVAAPTDSAVGASEGDDECDVPSDL